MWLADVAATYSVVDSPAAVGSAGVEGLVPGAPQVSVAVGAPSAPSTPPSAGAPSVVAPSAAEGSWAYARATNVSNAREAKTRGARI